MLHQNIVLDSNIKKDLNEEKYLPVFRWKFHEKNSFETYQRKGSEKGEKISIVDSNTFVTFRKHRFNSCRNTVENDVYQKEVEDELIASPIPQPPP